MADIEIKRVHVTAFGAFEGWFTPDEMNELCRNCDRDPAVQEHDRLKIECEVQKHFGTAESYRDVLTAYEAQRMRLREVVSQWYDANVRPRMEAEQEAAAAYGKFLTAAMKTMR